MVIQYNIHSGILYIDPHSSIFYFIHPSSILSDSYELNEDNACFSNQLCFNSFYDSLSLLEVKSGSKDSNIIIFE